MNASLHVKILLINKGYHTNMSSQKHEVKHSHRVLLTFKY